MAARRDFAGCHSEPASAGAESALRLVIATGLLVMIGMT